MTMKPILLAEDSADDQALILRALKKSNITNPILIANDGVEALDFLFGTGIRDEDGPIWPSVVLLDMKMPRLGGLDVLERIRKNPDTKYIPVVILTSSDEEQDMLRSYDLGANSYVRKPVDFKDFAEAVVELGLYWALLNEPPPEHRSR
ncbi:MAG TPA: response regulator [Desulfuromonadales bacterium]|nr:response regulator [Desulfuromonadales bacterium]